MSLAAVLAGCAIVRSLVVRVRLSAALARDHSPSVLGGVLAIVCPILLHTAPARTWSSTVSNLEEEGGAPPSSHRGGA
eukprot:1343374-Pleurochrysis_carterae.AAC.1